MATKRPIVDYDGVDQEIADGDVVDPDVISSFFETDPDVPATDIELKDGVLGIVPHTDGGGYLGRANRVWNEVEANHIIGAGVDLNDELDLKAPLASPTFTGTPEAPTPASNSDDTRIATTEWVNDRIVEASVAAAGRGLFSGLMSEDIPTQLLTGFSTWVNQGSATVADTAAGLTLYSPSNGAADGVRGLVKSVPATPYTVTALISVTSWNANNPAVGFGWRDSVSGKLHAMHLQTTGVFRAPIKWNSPTSWNGDSATGTFYGCRIWIKLYDDGTTVTFYFSVDGKNFYPSYSVAKASGFLGSSGYNQLIFYINPYSYAQWGTLESYLES